MKTNYTTINATTNAILASKFNIFQLQKRVNRAKKRSETARAIIDRHSKPNLTQYAPKRAFQAVGLAQLILHRCNSILGHALQHLTYHNVPVDEQPVTPHRSHATGRIIICANADQNSISAVPELI